MSEDESKPTRGRPKKRLYRSGRPNPKATVWTPEGVISGDQTVSLTEKQALPQVELGNLVLADADD